MGIPVCQGHSGMGLGEYAPQDVTIRSHVPTEKGAETVAGAPDVLSRRGKETHSEAERTESLRPAQSAQGTEHFVRTELMLNVQKAEP